MANNNKSIELLSLKNDDDDILSDDEDKKNIRDARKRILKRQDEKNVKLEKFMEKFSEYIFTLKSDIEISKKINEINHNFKDMFELEKQLTIKKKKKPTYAERLIGGQDFDDIKLDWLDNRTPSPIPHNNSIFSNPTHVNSFISGTLFNNTPQTYQTYHGNNNYEYTGFPTYPTYPTYPIIQTISRPQIKHTSNYTGFSQQQHNITQPIVDFSRVDFPIYQNNQNNNNGFSSNTGYPIEYNNFTGLQNINKQHLPNNINILSNISNIPNNNIPSNNIPNTTISSNEIYTKVNSGIANVECNYCKINGIKNKFGKTPFHFENQCFNKHPNLRPSNWKDRSENKKDE